MKKLLLALSLLHGPDPVGSKTRSRWSNVHWQVQVWAGISWAGASLNILGCKVAALVASCPAVEQSSCPAVASCSAVQLRVILAGSMLYITQNAIIPPSDPPPIETSNRFIVAFIHKCSSISTSHCFFSTEPAAKSSLHLCLDTSLQS